MRPTYAIQVRPKVPEVLKPLSRLSENLWFAWNPEAVELFQRLDPDLWSSTQHNPLALLGRVSQKRLEDLAHDPGFVAQMERVYSQMQAYMGETGCAFLGQRAMEGFQIAYFSAEYGLADCLPIYSGGLGMLSGDHLKSASDLNLPLVGLGLAYSTGYFNQYLNPDGWQQEEYRPNDFWNMPMELMTDDKGETLLIEVSIEGRPLKARAWRVMVGRVPLYLMDANLDQNPADLRDLTRHLYGGDTQMRIRQEILLGIGGVRLLKALGIKPTVYHMNEGHSAFASLERIRILRQEQGLSFDEAREVVRASNCFTTHTPVPAGNDYFEPDLVKRHFQDYMSGLGISMPVLLGYGRIHPTDQGEPFCMTVLALRLSSFNNGVSELHGSVSRNMWKEVWPHFPEEDVPITHITNGVHIPSWISNDMAYMLYRYLGPGWTEDPDSKAAWAGIEKIPDAELWRVHERRRSRTITFVRARLVEQLKRRGAGVEAMLHAAEVLNPEALTIVFARRFATYKRAVLLMQDPDRLAAILGNPERPVQIIFAGKAHPKDAEGKEFIRRVVAVAQERRFRDHIVFMEDYDINLGRYLVQGADVWLNTPRRPLEACGTSGMKASANGALNLSILDGWWVEGYSPGLGWAIGAGEEYTDETMQDEVESRALFRLLENEVVPLFYDRDDKDLPRRWIAYVKKSLSNVCPQFNTHRMLEDYAEVGYLPASERFIGLMGDEQQGAKQLGGWVRKIMERWQQVQVLSVNPPQQVRCHWGEEVEVRAHVRLGELAPEDVACEIYMGPLDAAGDFIQRTTLPMSAQGGHDGVFEFMGTGRLEYTGRMGIKVRVVPFHPRLSSRYALGLAAWG